MPCPDLEELLNDENNGHAVNCGKCRALLGAVARVDGILSAAFAQVSAPPGLAAAVRGRVALEVPERRPSPLPEVLDLIGWAAVLAVAAIVIPRFTSLLGSVLAGLG